MSLGYRYKIACSSVVRASLSGTSSVKLEGDKAKVTGSIPVMLFMKHEKPKTKFTPPRELSWRERAIKAEIEVGKLRAALARVKGERDWARNPESMGR